jgi:rhodanese-related sulfurtransferase
MNLPWWLPFGRVPEISARELNKLLKDGGAEYSGAEYNGAQLIDVRTPAEFAMGHVAGARNVPLYTLKQALPRLALDPERPIVAICATAHRSPPAVRLLRAVGYENTVQLKGGMISWYAAQLPTDKSPV